MLATQISTRPNRQRQQISIQDDGAFSRDVENTFPTRYLANTPADVRRLAMKAGFRVEAIDLIEGRPEYLRFSALTYLGGWMYERLVNTIPVLRRFRILLEAELRKA